MTKTSRSQASHVGAGRTAIHGNRFSLPTVTPRCSTQVEQPKIVVTQQQSTEQMKIVSLAVVSSPVAGPLRQANFTTPQISRIAFNRYAKFYCTVSSLLMVIAICFPSYVNITKHAHMIPIIQRQRTRSFWRRQTILFRIFSVRAILRTGRFYPEVETRGLIRSSSTWYATESYRDRENAQIL